MSSSALDKFKDMFSDASDNVSKSYSSFSNDKQGFLSSNGVYIGLFLVIIICLFIAYILYYFITTKLFLNIRQIVDETRIPIICTEKRRFNFDIKTTGNGERRSYTFWIYIHDMNKYAGNYKNVFNIQTSSTEKNPVNASPYVFLDKTDNKMYVRFGEFTDNNNINKDITSYNHITENKLKEFMKTGIVIPYIPLQRWVHVAIVCNANSYKNYIYAYIDGDLVSTTSNNEKDRYLGDTDDTRKRLTKLNINKSGIVNIGGELNDVEGPGFSGLISKITTFNYELNQKDVYNDYYWGPIGNILARLGLGMYGIRNPIYKL
jgi:hypothetical protein